MKLKYIRLCNSLLRIWTLSKGMPLWLWNKGYHEERINKKLSLVFPFSTSPSPAPG
jgi:hypothetical protein